MTDNNQNLSPRAFTVEMSVKIEHILNVIMAQTNGGKSLWMQNFAVRAADMGFNVLYVTLEMSERKVMKRLGAMRLKIPINDYDKMSNDVNLIKKRIANLSKQEGGDIFDKKVGKIITKFWAAGTATCSDFDNYIQKLKEKKDIKIDMIIVDEFCSSLFCLF